MRHVYLLRHEIESKRKEEKKYMGIKVETAAIEDNPKEKRDKIYPARSTRFVQPRWTTALLRLSVMSITVVFSVLENGDGELTREAR